MSTDNGAQDRLKTFLLPWAQSILDTVLECNSLPRDASNRYYHRIKSGQKTWILMDSYAEPEELIKFLKVGQVFKKAGVNVPKVLAFNEQLSACILTDFGPHTFRDVITLENSDGYINEALTALLHIQKAQFKEGPVFNKAVMTEELSRFQHWFVEKFCNVSLTAAQKRMLKQTYNRLILSATAQPIVPCHRDFHSENLMACTPRSGVIDFQSAINGPVTYDLVCLLRDARMQWPEDKVLEWAVMYQKRVEEQHIIAPVSHQQFLHWFDWMGIQVHLKILGIFARLCLRDEKNKYACFIPTALHYIQSVCDRYTILAPFQDFIGEITVPALAHIETIEL